MSGFINGKIVKDNSLVVDVKLNKNAHTTNLNDNKSIVNVEALSNQINTNKLETGIADSVNVDNGYQQINSSTTKMISFQEELVFNQINTDMVSLSLSDGLRTTIDNLVESTKYVNQETLIGTWFNGSQIVPLYRKVIVYDRLNSDFSNTNSGTINGIGQTTISIANPSTYLNGVTKIIKAHLYTGGQFESPCVGRVLTPILKFEFFGAFGAATNAGMQTYIIVEYIK